MKIKITRDGPYSVTGGVPIHEKIITPAGGRYILKEGRQLPQQESYDLCRCGRSKDAPFCDGSHRRYGFDGTETASRENYKDRAELIEGYSVDLLDDGRCAFARFCHRAGGDAWELTENSFNQKNRDEAIKAATECISGRLTALDKSGNEIEPQMEPSVDIIQDPQRGVSGGIFVKGYIPIESEDGFIYEPRNRTALCRCGKSDNKPFCDAMHVVVEYSDKRGRG